MGWRNFDENEKSKIWVLKIVNHDKVEENWEIYKRLDEVTLKFEFEFDFWEIVKKNGDEERKNDDWEGEIWRFRFRDPNWVGSGKWVWIDSGWVSK